VPTQDGLGAYRQPDLVQHAAGWSVQERGKQGPVGRGEAHLRTVQVPFEDRGLVA
jgi:hypothetical protein